MDGISGTELGDWRNGSMAWLEGFRVATSE